MKTKPKIALVYDRVNKWGGAERVLLALNKLYPDAPLYTLVHNPSTSKWAKDFKIVPSFFNSISFFRRKHELLAPVSQFGFESFNFDGFDIVISVTSSDAKAIITKPETFHISYCLTPTRYLWSGIKEYKKNPGLKKFSQLGTFGLNAFKDYFRNSDFVTAQRPDHYLTISKTVQDRIKKYYHHSSDLIYPGVDYDFWSKKPISDHKGYYLVVSRLVPYKKVDLVIKAFRHLPYKLKIVGTGSQKLYLKSIASSNVEFEGKVSDAKLRDLYRNAKALIFPQNEDFGLTPLEAQATGTPVIAYKKGGATETILPGKTGIFFSQPTTKSLINAIQKFELNQTSFNPQNCQNNAQKFSDTLFLSRFSDKVESLYETYRNRGRTR